MRGKVIKGSLSGGFEVKLNDGEYIEDVNVGNFVIAEGQKHKFFSLVVDAKIDSADSQALLDTDKENDSLIRDIINGSAVFEILSIAPMLMIAKEEEAKPGEKRIKQVKTIAPHCSEVRFAEEGDIFDVFGMPSDINFEIGTPIDMDIPICLNLNKFVERSNGIFGKSGTGKSFSTRVILAGIIKSRLATNLIFDMHNEYGWEGTDEGQDRSCKGLKQLFNADVEIFTLDGASARERKVARFTEVEIPYSQIAASDILMLGKELNLTPTAEEVMIALEKKYKERWLHEILNMDPLEMEDIAQEIGVNSKSLNALYSRLQKIERLPFVKEDGRVDRDAVDEIMKHLQESKNVVVEFGTNQNLLSYILVANILTRRIHARYTKLTEKALAQKNFKVKPLIITVEEAHRFLDPSIARNTIFGTIAREMRKNKVTLLVVDQRPSKIDDEIISQLGTRLTLKLNDDADISSVLTGVSKAKTLRNILDNLEEKQQALCLGYAAPMPFVFTPRLYNEAFYRDIGYQDFTVAPDHAGFAALISDLMPEDDE